MMGMTIFIAGVGKRSGKLLIIYYSGIRDTYYDGSIRYY